MQITATWPIVNNLAQANVDMLINRVSYYLGLKNLFLSECLLINEIGWE